MNIRWLIAPFLLIVSARSQHLPAGEYHPNRSRTYDIIHYRADLRIDWKTRSLSGEATITLRPLVTSSSVSLDAYRLAIGGVRNAKSGAPLKFSSDSTSLTVTLGTTLKQSDTIAIAVQYRATPSAGMYFLEASPGTNNAPAIFTYGEGGIHANWLPIYNDNNDKFSTEMIVTVNRPHTVISNGRLVETKERGDGTRTFHWLQTLPHSNYLIALFVGDYRPVPLRPAFGTIPLSVWVHPGQEEQAATVFQRTPEMVEFFSQRFNFRYPWDKYDQISAFDYAIGAMENTGITGHNDRILRDTGQTEEFNPDFETFTGNWTAEAIISHELAHHWFGNNTTCTNLANIWINESFASYLMMLWDEHRLGKEALQGEVWLARQAYLRYVEKSHIIRPLEYRYFDTRSDIYNTETTYQKGAIVLHQLRWILGDEGFFSALGYFQNKHKFSNVESKDLKTAIEESAGQNLGWYFNDWIWGGGHPVFEVQSLYIAGRKKLELAVEQVQPFVEGQDTFRLPVEIRIDAGGKTQRHVVWVESQSETFVFDVPASPSLVSFDGRGALVADIRFEKSLTELVYQAKHDELPGRLWAVQQLAAQYGSDPAVPVLFRTLVEGNTPWILKAEAVLQLRGIESQEAEDILLKQLTSENYHVRKAAAIALGDRFTESSRSALRRTIDSEHNDDVASTALVSLARIDGALSADLIERQLTAPSWYDCKRIAALKAVEILATMHSIPQKDKFVPYARRYAEVKFNYGVRQQAITTWAACSPDDPMLTDRLTSFARNDILPVRIAALELLGKLKIDKALPALEEVVRTNGDSDIRHAARSALEAIRGTGRN